VLFSCCPCQLFARWRVPSSPYINRFLQPDTIIPGAANPQNWNRFSYVLNSPIIYLDPSGRCTVAGHWMPDSSAACDWYNVESAISKPSDQCTGDCHDAYLTYKSLAHKLHRIPSLKEILYMTADTEYTLYAGYKGVREFGQEGLARNYYEQCFSDSLEGCQGDELYNFLSAYQPWSDWKGTDNNKKTPGERAQTLQNTLNQNKTWLWDDVLPILNPVSDEEKSWMDGKWDGQPWQWFGPMRPSQYCINHVSPFLSITNEDGTRFWMLFAEEDDIFDNYCP